MSFRIKNKNDTYVTTLVADQIVTIPARTIYPDTFEDHDISPTLRRQFAKDILVKIDVSRAEYRPQDSRIEYEQNEEIEEKEEIDEL